jgi:hypothetical protein
MSGIESCNGVPNGDVWADAGAAPSAAMLPATAAPPFRRSLRLVRFDPIRHPTEKWHEIKTLQTKAYSSDGLAPTADLRVSRGTPCGAGNAVNRLLNLGFSR